MFVLSFFLDSNAAGIKMLPIIRVRLDPEILTDNPSLFSILFDINFLLHRILIMKNAASLQTFKDKLVWTVADKKAARSTNDNHDQGNSTRVEAFHWAPSYNNSGVFISFNIN